MKTKLINIWTSLKASFWFIPALMIVVAIIMAFDLVTVDRAFNSITFDFYGFAYSVSPEGHGLSSRLLPDP